VCEKVTWATLIYLLKTKEKPNNKRKRCGGRVIIMRNNEKGGVGVEEKRKTKKKVRKWWIPGGTKGKTEVTVKRKSLRVKAKLLR